MSRFDGTIFDCDRCKRSVRLENDTIGKPEKNIITDYGWICVVVQKLNTDNGTRSIDNDTFYFCIDCKSIFDRHFQSVKERPAKKKVKSK